VTQRGRGREGARAPSGRPRGISPRARYFGRKAAEYDRERRDQPKWRRQNEAVEEWLTTSPLETVLDIPVGTGRYVALYEKRGLNWTGVDISQDMLDQAAKKLRPSSRHRLMLGDIREKCWRASVVVCIRMLHLLEPTEADAALKNVLAAAMKTVILTVRLRETTGGRLDVGTMTRRHFLGIVSRAGWRVAEERPTSGAGTVIARIVRK
jgi:SAM-dependent methyltransferase